MEITDEIKSKVFAQYLGQHMQVPNKGNNNDENIIGELCGLFADAGLDETADDSGEGHHYIRECKLILKPLSKLTDQSAIQVCKIAGDLGENDADIIFMGRMLIETYISNIRCSVTGLQWLSIFQYLQQQGYDLPNYLLDGKTLHEAGLAIYED